MPPYIFPLFFPFILYSLISYLQLNIPIDEFENKKLFKCVFVSMRLKEEVSHYYNSGTAKTLYSCINHFLLCVVLCCRKNLWCMWTGMAQLTICSKKQKVRYVNMHVTVQPEYWWESNLVVSSKIPIATVDGSKFGSSVQDHYTCMYIHVCV